MSSSKRRGKSSMSTQQLHNAAKAVLTRRGGQATGDATDDGQAMQQPMAPPQGLTDRPGQVLGSPPVQQPLVSQPPLGQPLA